MENSDVLFNVEVNKDPQNLDLSEDLDDSLTLFQLLSAVPSFGGANLDWHVGGMLQTLLHKPVEILPSLRLRANCTLFSMFQWIKFSPFCILLLFFLPSLAVNTTNSINSNGL